MRRPAAFDAPRLRLGGVRLTPLQTGLLVGSLALSVGCSWLLVARNGTLAAGAAAPPLPPPRAVDAPARPASPLQYNAIVALNPFARSRQPPAEPWMPVETGAEGDAAAAPSVDGSSGPLQLFGTVAASSPEKSFAIIEADPSRPGPERYQVGDSVATYRLRAIYRGRVILAGSAGDVELSLAPDTVRGGGGKP